MRPYTRICSHIRVYARIYAYIHVRPYVYMVLVIRYYPRRNSQEDNFINDYLTYFISVLFTARRRVAAESRSTSSLRSVAGIGLGDVRWNYITFGADPVVYLQHTKFYGVVCKEQRRNP